MWVPLSRGLAPQIKNLTKIGTNFNSSFLSFDALLTPTNSSHKKQIVTPNECIGMKELEINQGRRQTQQHSLILAFSFIWGSTCAHREVPKKENANDLK